MVCSHTQLCYGGVFNEYMMEQLHVSACTGHLQVVLENLRTIVIKYTSVTQLCVTTYHFLVKYDFYVSYDNGKITFKY